MSEVQESRMIRVRLKQPIVASYKLAMHAGQEYEFDEHEAMRLIDRGLAVGLDIKTEAKQAEAPANRMKRPPANRKK